MTNDTRRPTDAHLEESPVEARTPGERLAAVEAAVAEIRAELEGLLPLVRARLAGGVAK